MKFGKESEMLEFKVSTNEIDEAIIDIVAILNKHSRGLLYFGVKNNGDLCGFQIGENTERDISRKIYEGIKPQIFPIITLDSIENKKYIKVEFEGDFKPYSAMGRYYIRTSDESREMTPSELAKFIMNQNYSSWEKLESECTIDDIDELALQTFLTKAINCQRMPTMSYNKEEILTKLNLLGKDKIHLNNAGKLLFSKTNPIKVKMGVFASNEKRTFIDIAPISGNIITLIDSIEKYIEKNIHYSVRINGFNREDVPEIPEVALREIITNSFAHANYLSNSQHEIDIFPNRVLIYNPGAFPDNYKPEDFVNNTLSSKIINPLICDVLFKCKAIEAWGTGLKNTYEVCKREEVPISYQKEQEGFWFIFYRKTNTENYSNELEEQENVILREIINDNNISRQTLSEITGRSTRTVQRITDILKDKGYIKREGNARNGVWKILK